MDMKPGGSKKEIGLPSPISLWDTQVAGRTYNDPAWRIAAAEGGAFPEEELPFVKVMATGLPVRDVEHAARTPTAAGSSCPSMPRLCTTLQDDPPRTP
jgi:hypothetical protein